MNSNDKVYSIKDLENTCGIKAHTIRMWEKRYGILAPCRTNTNIREYTEDELKKLMIVSLLNRKGLKISRIAHLKDNELLHEIVRLNQVDPDKALEKKLNEIIAPALRFDETGFRMTLRRIVQSSGLENAYVRFFYPLMMNTMTLWLTDCISLPQAKFIMNVIRHLIQTEELSLNTPVVRQTVAFVDLGNLESTNDLFFLKYLLHKRGFDVIFTEARLTGGDIQSIHKIKPFRQLVLNVSSTAPDDEVKDICQSLIHDLKLSKVLILGRLNSSPPFKNGKTDVVCHPSSLITWADNL